MSGSGERRFDVSGLQVMASALATITGAVAASYLGVAGTIIGAAVMSVASTAGSAFYKHYLGRTARRLKEATPVAAAQRAAEWMSAGARTAAYHGHPDGAAQTRAGQTRAGQTRAGQTRAGQTRVDATRVNQTLADLSRAAEGGDHAGQDDNAAAASPQNADSTDAGTGAGGSGRLRAWSAWLRAKPAWLAAALVSLGIFAGVIGGITVFEAAAGKPLQTVVWNHKGTGTTVGGLVGGQPSHPRPRATRQASATHSASPTPTPGSSQSSSTIPSPTPSSGSPSPSSSASPTPTATSPSASPGAASAG